MPGSLCFGPAGHLLQVLGDCIARLYREGLRGVVMGQGDTYEAALADAKSAAQFHIESFGAEAFDDDSDVEAAYVAEGTVAA
jgi:hypothetical protein